MPADKTIPIGTVFTRWTVIGRSERRFHIICQCQCGKIATIATHPLLTGRSKSCGCARPKGRQVKKKKKSAPTYISWCSMMARCSNQKDKAYKHYGGRGIGVCERWGTFSLFLEDMGPRPGGSSLERKDNDGNYEPSNCRWATQKEQCRNTSRNRIITAFGKTACVAELAESHGISSHAVFYRLNHGWSAERALTTPCNTTRRKSVASEMLGFRYEDDW